MIFPFLVSMFMYCLIATPFYFLLRFEVLKGKRRYPRREFWMFLFFLFCVCIFSQTIIPTSDLDKGYARSNFIPFETIRLYANQLQGPFASIAFYNLAGNILLFIPFGFFIPLLWPKMRHKWGMLLLAFIIPLFIEGVQYFIGRSTDIDDVILNTFAIVLGAFLFKFGKYLVKLLKK